MSSLPAKKKELDFTDRVCRQIQARVRYEVILLYNSLKVPPVSESTTNHMLCSSEMVHQVDN